MAQFPARDQADQLESLSSSVSGSPLVVDLDGTLVATDLLWESLFALISRRPSALPRLALAVIRGRAAAKDFLSRNASFDPTTVPLDPTLLHFLRLEKKKGRRIYLASAAARSYAEAVAERVGLFDGVFASDARTNLKGAAKAQALVAQFGEGSFDYIGNSRADLAVWAVASRVIAVNVPAPLVKTIEKRWPGAFILSRRRFDVTHYASMLRLHQWLKNLLVLVPAFTSHSFDEATLVKCLLAFFSFSFCASGTYVINDLLDLSNDRSHSHKRHRPLASGRVPLLHGVVLSGSALALSAAFASYLSPDFALVLLAYFGTTLAYSLALKRQPVLDVVVLAALYGIRLVAGGVAVAVPLSPWLLMFSLFLFLSLALVKRSTELIDRRKDGLDDPAGRGYRVSDAPMLEMMSASSGYVAALVFCLYVNSPAVAALYTHPLRLWAAPVVLVYWVSRMTMIAHRGQMHSDPVLFAARDPVSLVCGAIMVLIVAISM